MLTEMPTGGTYSFANGGGLTDAPADWEIMRSGDNRWTYFSTANIRTIDNTQQALDLDSDLLINAVSEWSMPTLVNTPTVSRASITIYREVNALAEPAAPGPETLPSELNYNFTTNALNITSQRDSESIMARDGTNWIEESTGRNRWRYFATATLLTLNPGDSDSETVFSTTLQTCLLYTSPSPRD